MAFFIMKTFDHRTIKPQVEWLNYKLDQQELQNSLISVQTAKNINQPCGTWQIELLPQVFPKGRFASSTQAAAYWYAAINPMDVVSIGFQKKHGCMLGLVDSVHKSKITRRGRFRQTVIVRGRDFGKVLVEDNVTFHPEFTTDEEFKKALEGNPLLKNILNQRYLMRTSEEKPGEQIVDAWATKKIIEGMKYIVEELTSIRILCEYDPEKIRQGQRKLEELHNHLLLDLWQRSGDTIVEGRNLMTYQGSIWNYLQACIDKDFYELFVDSKVVEKEGKAILRLRPKPFDRKGDQITGGIFTITNPDGDVKKLYWDDFETFIQPEDGTKRLRWVIPQEDVLEKAGGITDHGAYSIYGVAAVNELLSTELNVKAWVYYPLLDINALNKYGLRERIMRSRLFTDVEMQKYDRLKWLQENKGSQAERKKLAEELKDTIAENRIKPNRDRAYNWYRLNPIFESGEMPIKGNEDIRIGDKIDMPDEIAKDGSQGIEAYVTGATNRWSFGSAHETTLQYERGCNKEILAKFNKHHSLDKIRREMFKEGKGKL